MNDWKWRRRFKIFTHLESELRFMKRRDWYFSYRVIEKLRGGGKYFQFGKNLFTKGMDIE